MNKDEAQHLLVLLEEAIHGSRRSRREIERKLGLGQGYLGSLFRGRIELKVWHVYTLARELGLEPLTFFLQASPPRDPHWMMQQLGVASSDKPPLPEPGEEAPLTRDEVESLIRRTLRQELDRLASGAAKL
jgi:hypothetical protein